MQAFIFDMDGVIIDSEKVYEQADQKWFAENGIQTDRIALRQCLGCTDDVNWGIGISLKFIGNIVNSARRSE